MPIYKKNDKWYSVVSYVGLDGKYKKAQSKYYDTKREAIESEITLRQKYKNTDRYSINFEEAYREFINWKSETLKPQSINKLDSLYEYVKPLSKIKVEKLTQQQYKVFKEQLNQKSIGVIRKNRVHRLICNIIDYCNSNYGIYNDVPRRLGGYHEQQIKQEMNFFTIEEFEKFISQENDIVYKTLFTLLFFNGLRIGEALALTWKDCDGEININKTLVTKLKGVKPYASTPKTKNSIRRLPVNDRVKSLLEELRAYYERFPHFNEQWYIFGGIKPLSETGITNRKNDDCKKAGVKQIRLHDFRHSCASYYIKNKNAPIILISKLLGHSKISMTLDTYSHLYPNELAKLMQN